MPQSSVTWQETISRGTAIALMHNFTSVAEALKELVDNAIDYRWGQPLLIEIALDKRRHRVIIDCDGGRGMGAEEIQVWLNWGEGEQHDGSHIGRWHQGGKAACGFLAQHVKLWGKRKGSSEVWFLEDKDWNSRRKPKNFGRAVPLSTDQYPPALQDVTTDRGHVRIELIKIVKGKRWNIEDLRRDLASTYRSLLSSGGVRIKIYGADVPPLDIPLSTAVQQRTIDVKLPGSRTVTGWAGRMKRDQLDAPVKAGLRLLHNGRLIKQGEWFGYNYEGKGALNSLVGELDLRGFTPVPNKTDFVDRGDEVWEELGQKVRDQLAPLISELRGAGQETPVTKEEKHRAQEVASELERVLASLREKPDASLSTGSNGKSEAGPGGRNRPEPRPKRLPVQNPRGPNQTPQRPRTHPPEDPVGSIARLLAKVTGGNTRPPLRIRSWDRTERATWTPEGALAWLDINSNYHLYKSFNGIKPYIAETAILELCRPREGEMMLAAQYLDRVNLMLIKWAQIAGQEAGD